MLLLVLVFMFGSIAAFLNCLLLCGLVWIVCQAPELVLCLQPYRAAPQPARFALPTPASLQGCAVTTLALETPP